MQSLIKLNNKVIAVLDNQVILEKEVSLDEYLELKNAKTDEEVITILNPQYKKALESYNKTVTLLDKINQSKTLTIKNNIIYWEEVSHLSVPLDLAESIINAEINNDKIKINAYKNFWTLMCLNTDEDCRNNLYWFLKLHGLTISKSGFFVAYRNVDYTKEKGVYTDNYTHTFKIKIGEMVTMNREETDSNSNIECSRGLHVASKKWLKKNYYGEIGLACLVNPVDVVAVPKRSEYGKLRTCAYLPIATIKYNQDNEVIPLNVEDGFDCEYVTKVIYEGIMGTEKDSPYKISIPNSPKIKIESIQNTLLDIARECIIHREL